MSAESQPTPQPTQGGPATLLLWLLAGAVFLTVLALAGAHAPARIKLLGLFAVAVGLAGGGLLALATHVSGRPARRAMLPLSVLLIAACQVGMTAEAHRIYAEEFREARKENTALKMYREMLKDPDYPEDMKPALRRDIRVHERRERELDEAETFRGYLAHRVSPLGDWPRPWPAVFWLGEVLVAALAGAWLAVRLSLRSQ